MKKIKTLVLVLCAGALNACSPSSFSEPPLENQNGNIVGGSNTQGLSAGRNSTVMLKKLNPSTDKGFTTTCTGTLVSKNVILTAAHCAPTRNEKLFVIFEDADYESTVESRGVVRQFIQHPQYVAGVVVQSSDIALLSFTRKKGLPAGFKPRSLPEDKPYTFTSFLMVGAGFNYPGSGDGYMRSVRLGTSALSANQNGIFQLNQTSGRGICNGDSGGPLFIENDGVLTLVGVTTFAVNYPFTW